jgi:hypothetical protein
MRCGRMTAAAMWAVAGITAGPVLAQQVPLAATPPAAPPSPGADQDFLLGLRRMGVVAGHAVACAPQRNREPVIESASDLAKEIAMQFGLNAAFHFMGAVGYGSGHPFDKAICAQAEQDWKAIQQKYMGQ